MLVRWRSLNRGAGMGMELLCLVGPKMYAKRLKRRDSKRLGLCQTSLARFRGQLSCTVS